MLLRLLLAIMALSGLLTATAQADDDDTRLLLNQIDQRTAERERGYLPEETPPGMDPASLITIGKTTYSVENTLADLEPAIYVSMNLRQWPKLAQFVQKYQQLPSYDTSLVLLAEGMLAREARDYGTAERKLEQALQANPQFSRAKLELARMYFENQKSREAAELFKQISIAGIPEAVRPVIESFENALGERNAWHGSFALGMGYNSNINQANGMSTQFITCLLPGILCRQATRTMPAPISSAMLSYDFAAMRRYPLAGHHNLLVRGISYGKLPRQNRLADNVTTHYDESTSLLYAGYNYLSASQDVSLTPLFEHNYGNHHVRYQAAGLRLDWKYTLAPGAQLGVNAQRKHFSFRGQERQYFANYDENQFGLYGSYLLNPKTALYGGFNFTRKLFPDRTASSKEYMANLGMYRHFDTGFRLNATALYRRIRNDEFNGLMGGRRKDHQQIYIVNLAMPRLAFAGVTPNLYLKRTVNNSSLDWAYAYRQTEAILKLEASF